MTASFPDLTRTEIDSKTDTDAGSLESEGTGECPLSILEYT